MNLDHTKANQAIENAHQALRRGDRGSARRWAEHAAALAPYLEEPWLLLAAVSTPQTSLRYLQRALHINPNSSRARAGMEQISQQLNAPVSGATRPIHPLQARRMSKVPVRQRTASWLVVLALILVGAALVGGVFTARAVFSPPATVLEESWSLVKVSKPTYTPSPVPTVTPTPVPTDASTPTRTPETNLQEPAPENNTMVDAVGLTYVVQDGDTLGYIASRFGVTIDEVVGANNLVDPSSIYTGQELVIPGLEYIPPASVSIGGPKYILVDISEQHLYAYEGDVLLYSFMASTGMNNATAIGDFSVLNKIPNAYGSTWNIWMPNWLGIYWAGGLQNGIHALPIMPSGARLWSGYLGTPISYGCIVLGEYEAQLLYDWAEIGTPVVIQW